MAELKTRLTDADVGAFLNTIEDESKRSDAFAILEIYRAITKLAPEMWGPSIVGFGRFTYKYPNGKEMEWMQAAYSPRKQYHSVYIHDEFDGREELLEQLGKHKMGKSCLTFKRLDDIHVPTLKKLIRASFKKSKQLARES